jgi:putative transposase
MAGKTEETYFLVFMRKINFSNNEYYHIYNRGTDKRDIFLDEDDYLRFLKSMTEFNTSKIDGGLYRKFLRERADGKGCDQGSASNLEAEPLSDPLVEFICYCLNPNHYHFIVRQLVENGIAKFMQRLGTSYTMYFNTKNNRNGVLFQGKFKAAQITSFEHLLWLSVYVNTNAQIHGITDNATKKSY